ncbi:MAG: thioredoxin domain-containing protein [Methanomassiliicoccales archaeon]|nr:thioredoxin domain-containing protein [Methanomassiliicoccales archaeon]
MQRGSERRANRLISEKSPYLLQHAYNPVDWYPWGEEAFERARTDDRPVFLSIGYSTCHWCHVMERESFEDPDIARMMNEAFVCIKVDREERPDIDSVYMEACQMISGTGGWPLTIFTTPDKRPFFATTYVPKETLYGRIGMTDLIPNIEKIWKFHRDKTEDIAERVVLALKEATCESQEGHFLSRKAMDDAFDRLVESYDDRHGGFGQAPKFPTPSKLCFLLRYWHLTGNARALDMTERTLRMIRDGGIFDHIGFGIHRYSTDQAWMIPHFEKMLYDQALLAIAYAETYQATGKEECARTLRDILRYVLRDLQGPDGGFFSAEDADSEGSEGRFYLWSMDEIRAALPSEQAEVVLAAFDLGRGDALNQDGTLKDEGVLHRVKALEDVAADVGLEVERVRSLLDDAMSRMFTIREARTRPSKDDKILTDWNGLFIAALAKSAQVLDDPTYIAAASRAVDFLLLRMVNPEGRLYHRFRDGEAGIEAFLSDYAFLIWGLIELYEATFDARYLGRAIGFTKTMVDTFWDPKGGFFSSAGEVLVRRKDLYDGAMPSGNSIALLCLLRLSQITDDAELGRIASETIRIQSGMVSAVPEAFTQFLIAFDYWLDAPMEIVVLEGSDKSVFEEMIRGVRQRFIPNKAIVVKRLEGADHGIEEISNLLEGKQLIGGRTTAYVCVDRSCRQPTADPLEFIRIIESKNETAGTKGRKVES